MRGQAITGSFPHFSLWRKQYVANEEQKKRAADGSEGGRGADRIGHGVSSGSA